MKRNLIFPATIIVLVLFVPACDQAYRADTTNLEGIREDCRELIESIDETLAKQNAEQFINSMHDVLGNLDGMLDDYLNEMDNAGQRLDRDAVDHVIGLKEKRVEAAFKLALLEDNND